MTGTIRSKQSIDNACVKLRRNSEYHCNESISSKSFSITLNKSHHSHESVATFMVTWSPSSMHNDRNDRFEFFSFFAKWHQLWFAEWVCVGPLQTICRSAMSIDDFFHRKWPFETMNNQKARKEEEVEGAKEKNAVEFCGGGAELVHALDAPIEWKSNESLLFHECLISRFVLPTFSFRRTSPFCNALCDFRSNWNTFAISVVLMVRSAEPSRWPWYWWWWRFSVRCFLFVAFQWFSRNGPLRASQWWMEATGGLLRWPTFGMVSEGDFRSTWLSRGSIAFVATITHAHRNLNGFNAINRNLRLPSKCFESRSQYDNIATDNLLISSATHVSASRNNDKICNCANQTSFRIFHNRKVRGVETMWVCAPRPARCTRCIAEMLKFCPKYIRNRRHFAFAWSTME